MQLEEPKGRVLVVDDDLTLLRTHERILARTGYTVETAADGSEAVSRIKSGGFDAIVSDIAMPQMDGIALLRGVRSIDLDLPVILLTARPAVETAAEAVQYGAFRYLTKPIANDILTREVGRAVRLYSWAKLRRASQLGGDVLEVGDRAGLDAAFGRALEGLWMAFQPIVSARGQTTYAFEALMRSKERALPFPGAVIRAAERLDRCEDLGRRVRHLVGEVLDQSTPIAFVNLHVRDLLDEELYDTTSGLGRHAKRVVLEITERAALDEVADVRSRIARLRELGFRIAVDDLGAGFAGLTSFAQLEPDVVKVDMSLVRNIHLEPVKQKLVGAIATLCRDLGIILIVEGVETPEERDSLLELGCDLLQGYLFARPAAPFPDVHW